MSTPVAMMLALGLLAANGFFVASEFALVAARRARLEQLAAVGDRRAAHAAAATRELSLMLAGAQLGITICSLGLGAVAEPAVARLVEAGVRGAVELPRAVSHGIAFAVALSLVVFLHMVVGEMAPKSWAISRPERSALILARPFRGFVVVLRPVIRLLNALANAVVRLCRVEPQDALSMAHTPADLQLLLEESATLGTIEPEAQHLLSRSLTLSGLDAASAMTPRDQIVAVDGADSTDVVAWVAHRTGRSRVVVHDGDLDHILGVLHAKDLLILDRDQLARVTARDLARPALVVPADRHLEDVLVDMRASRQHLAVAVERGRTVGVVSLEDVLEELIGDFEDEFDLR
jgi:CBS domain containing-hemolysin-like protein